jgi:O-methyltransferase involved in polyketide biosynthesis
MDSDRNIMATAEDAILAKQATVQTGYYEDPFLEPFARSSVGITRRRQIQPIIKRGTHARVCCMDRAISAFILKQHGECQMVVLGSGKDTSYFRYRAGKIMGMEQQPTTTNNNNNNPHPQVVHWYEVDHRTVIQEKSTIIQRSPSLSSHCALQPTNYGFTTSNKDFHMVEHDLRDSPVTLLQKLQLNAQLPTLFLLECVFMYLPNPASKALLETLSTSVDKAWIVGYEPILGNTNDPFGQMMQQNLVQASVATPHSCLLQTRTLQAQLSKLMDSGFHKAVGCDMWSAYETILTHDQRRRANQMEFLDEVEEWMLIMRHYCFFAARGGTTREDDTNDDDDDDDMTGVGAEAPLGFLPGKCQVEMEPERVKKS